MHRRCALACLALAACATSRAATPRPARAPVVILKLDDLRNDERSRVRFGQVADLVDRKHVRASFGIIADGYVDDGSKQALYEWTRGIAARGSIEFWHHGLEHTRTEFANGDLASQAEHLAKPVQILKDTCGITLHAFGAPYNQNDATTLEAMKSVPELKIWMLGKVAAGATQGPLLLTTQVKVESKTGIIDPELFQRSYALQTSADYVILQAHPPYWRDVDLAAFEGIVDFLIAKGATFMTPSEYAKKVTSTSTTSPPQARPRP